MRGRETGKEKRAERMGVAIEKLKGVALFRGLSEGEMEEVVSLGREVEWEEGETVFTEDELGDTMLIIYAGAMKVSKSITLQGLEGADLSDKVLMNMEATEPVVVGEVAVLTKQARTATITTTKRCMGLEISGSDLAELCERKPRLGFKLMQNLACLLSERLRSSNRDVVRLATALSVALG